MLLRPPALTRPTNQPPLLLVVVVVIITNPMMVSIAQSRVSVHAAFLTPESGEGIHAAVAIQTSLDSDQLTASQKEDTNDNVLLWHRL
ncbi:unnamed protein product [Arctogadus glacialis]